MFRLSQATSAYIRQLGRAKAKAKLIARKAK